MTPDTFNVSGFPLPLSLIWKRRKFIVRLGIYCALIAFAVFLTMSWKTKYEALLRIEPELSTTGETTSIESEMDIIQSWSVVTKAVSLVGHTANINSKHSNLRLHLAYYCDYIKSMLSGAPAPDYSSYQPYIRLDDFSLTGNNETYLNRNFFLVANTAETYTLYDSQGKKLLDGKTGAIEKTKLNEDNKQTLEILVSKIISPPGGDFIITPLPFDSFAKSMQTALTVERKGFRERSGLMLVECSNKDPELAKQFLEALTRVYLEEAYDRSSVGKIQGLAKLEEQSQVLRKELADAEHTLAAFKDTNHIVNLVQEQEYMYKRSLIVQEDLQKITTKYKELNPSLTDSHPAMLALRKQRDFDINELKELQSSLESMPQKERQMNGLQNNVAIAKAILDQNTLLVAQLHSEVQTITGYAHLISLHLNEKLSPFLRGVITIFLGFTTGSLLALSWLIRSTSPAFAQIRYTEDLTNIAPLPVIANLPFKWSGMQWLWYAPRSKQAVSSVQEWVAASTGEIERLEQEIPFLLPQSANKTLLFTGIETHLDAAFCARKLAVASARLHKTLLIDANIMQPSLHEEFSCKNTSGLADILIGRSAIQDVIQPSSIPNLYLLPAGKRTPNFRLLSHNEHIKQLLTELSPLFDRIVIEFRALTPQSYQKNFFDIFDALFIVVNRDIRANKVSVTLQANNIPEHNTAFFILNKK